MSHINERWVAIDGSVYTEEQRTRVVGGQIITHHPSIAFNVGHTMAAHIVEMHNKSLLGDLELDLPPDAMASLLEAARNPVHVPLVRRASDLPPPHDSLEEAQRAAGIWPQGGAAPSWKRIDEVGGAKVRAVSHEDGRVVIYAPPTPHIGVAHYVMLPRLTADGTFPHGAAIRFATEDEVAAFNAAYPDNLPAIAEAGHSTGMSSVMQVQGSSLRPVEIGQAVVASDPAPKPCCGCKKG
jgi:hypothetical protein